MDLDIGERVVFCQGCGSLPPMITVAVHRVEAGWVVAENDVWLPGVYESEALARRAVLLTDGELTQAQDRANARMLAGAGGTISAADLPA